jgi:hypothetical protein
MTKRNIDDIAGICFPVIPEHIERIFIKENILFPKISVHNVLPLYCKKGQKLFFYRSHSNKEIIGEGTIIDIKLLDVDEFNRRIKQSFISTEEFNNYIAGRIKKKIISIKVEQIHRYIKPVQLSYYVTMGGRYITKKEYAKWDTKIR